ncbi:MAG: hypothetical protein GY765_08115 [bacterium]|nr:hypothetical protein [bacterium]
MADSHPAFYLDELYPVEIFNILLTAATKYYGRFLNEIRVIIPENSIYGTLAVLVLPDVFADKSAANRERIQVYHTVVQAYRELKNREPHQGGTPPAGKLVTLLEGLSRLLLAPAHMTSEAPSPVESDEYMVVGRDMQREEIVSMINTLSLHATNTRVAGVQMARGKRYFFYLKDDHQRRSSFLSFAAGEGLRGKLLLKGFKSGDLVVFLPADCEPGAVQLDYFCRFLQTAPLLFRKTLEKVKKGVLAAVSRWPRPSQEGAADKGHDIEFLYFAGLKFYNQTVFQKPATDYATFQYLDLQSGEMSLEVLEKEIQSTTSDIGYRLELRPTRHLEVTKADRLYEEKARVEYQLAYLESITRPVPVLYRFTQKQLPALADIVRSFPLKVLRDGNLKYAFQATQSDPAGLHFVLVESAEVVMNNLDPLPLWEDLDVRPMRFRLDPFWARYYHDQGGNAMVFVPEGCSLFPPIHDWDKRSMDTYLGETVKQWFRGRMEGVTIPEYPLYLFDGNAEPQAEIQVSLLDRMGFRPLHTRLGWLNDNLTVVQAVGAEELISQMAEGLTWEQLYGMLMKDAEATKVEFEETALMAGKRVADTVHEMTETLTEEVNRVMENTFKMAVKVKALDGRLKEWEGVCTGMEALLDEVNGKQERTLLSTVKATNEFHTMVKQIDHEIIASNKARLDVEKQIDAEINHLKETYKKLREKLSKGKLWS